MWKCENCGKLNEGKFCTSCGRSAEGKTEDTKTSSSFDGGVTVRYKIIYIMKRRGAKGKAAMQNRAKRKQRRYILFWRLFSECSF